MRAHGQTLVLFALTMLLLTVMVLMTLGLGARIHERQEQQEVADAAAYSEAVVTARTFNALSTMNRTLVAQMSTVAAAQSLLSWAGFYHGVLNQARDLLMDLASNGCAAPELLQARQNIMTEDRRLIDIWEPPAPLGNYGGIDGYDVRSANYIRNVLYAPTLDIAADQRALFTEMTADISPSGGGGIAARVAQKARAGSPWASNPLELYAEDQPVTRQERSAATLDPQLHPKHEVLATMAARGTDRFLSSREANVITGNMSAGNYVETRINYVMDSTGASPLVAHVTDYGTSYFGDDGPNRGSGIGEHDGYDGEALNYNDWKKQFDINNPGYGVAFKGAWAQDSGHFYFTWPNPPAGCNIGAVTEDAFGYIVTTNTNSSWSNHMWRRGNAGYGDYREWNDELNHVLDWPETGGPKPARHEFQVTPPGANSPSIWPVFVDFNQNRLDAANAKDDVYGVPKELVPIVRDYGSRTSRDPWEMRFDFKLGPSSSGQLIDLREQRTVNGISFTKSVAIATGLAYYHRGDAAGAGNSHAKEPPNFLNPFWRATLVASDVDESYANRGTDVINTLNAIDPTQASTLSLMRGQGFEAVP
jgi:hypothetical protein